MTAPVGGPPRPAAAEAQQVVAELTARRQHVAVAESLTGGLLAAALASVPGASVVFRGAIVAYATDLKASLLGVDQAVLDSRGAVSAETAQAMAEGVRSRLGATFGLATTGVAGPIRPRGSRWARCTLQLPGGTAARAPGRLAIVTTTSSAGSSWPGAGTTSAAKLSPKPWRCSLS